METGALHLLIVVFGLLFAVYIIYFTVKAVLSIIINLFKLALVAAAIVGLLYGFPAIMAFLQQLQTTQAGL
jgi:hypothetical protein